MLAILDLGIWCIMLKYILAIVVFVAILFGSHVYASEQQLRDKIGQMLMVSFLGDHVDENSTIVKNIEQSNVGGVVLFDYDPATRRFDRNIKSPEQVQALNQQLQTFTREANLAHNRSPLPLLISVDYEGGSVVRLKPEYGFPVTPSAAEIGQLTLSDADPVAESMAQTLESNGFNLNYAPVVDVNINPANPIIGKRGRSFSSNPSDVVRYAELFSQHYLNHHIQCTYKHFPGHGSSTSDSHLGFVDVSDVWQSDELTPYQQLLNSPSSCGAVMTAHIINRNLDDSGLPATLSHKILTELLRENMHFNGVIITDDMEMKAIANNYGLEQAITLSINAGADILMFTGHDPKTLIDIIQHQVELGNISRDRIEEAYQRIVTFKQSLTAA